MARENFEDLRIYELSEKLADEVWGCVTRWNNLAHDTKAKGQTVAHAGTK